MHEEYRRHNSNKIAMQSPRLTLMTPKAASALQSSSLSIPLTLNTDDLGPSSSEMINRMNNKSASASRVYGMESKRASMDDLRVPERAPTPIHAKREEGVLITTPSKNEFAMPDKVFCEERLASASGWTRYRNVKAEVEYAYAPESSVTTTTAKNEYGPMVRHELAPKPAVISDYRIIKTIGSGSTGKVKLAGHVMTGEQVAIKMIPRLRTTKNQKSKESIVSRERRILREAATLYLLDHPNIVGLKDMLITEDYFFLIFEYIKGEELLDHIVARKKLSEGRAKKYFAQLLSAVAYCHANGVVHRDLKIENVLIAPSTPSSNNNNVIKLVDFGLSNFYHPRGKLMTYCGSLYFAAPELLSGKPYCGPEVDVWSLGVILYVMLCGKVPFDDKSLNTLHSKIKRGVFEIPKDLSPSVKDLLHSMMCVDPTARIRISQLMNHPWLKDAIPRSYPCVGVPIEKPDDVILQHLLEEFAPLQFDGVPGILDVFRKALTEWPTIHDHPLIKLYHLTAAKLKKSPKPIVGLGERSKSVGELDDALAVPELRQMEPAITRIRSYSFLDQTRRLALHPATNMDAQENHPMTDTQDSPRIHRRTLQNGSGGRKKSSWWRCSIQ